MDRDQVFFVGGADKLVSSVELSSGVSDDSSVECFADASADSSIECSAGVSADSSIELSTGSPFDASTDSRSLVAESWPPVGSSLRGVCFLKPQSSTQISEPC